MKRSTASLSRKRLQSQRSFEALEARSMLTVAFSYALQDPAGAFVPYPVVKQAMSIAQNAMSNLLEGKGEILVKVTPNVYLPIPGDGQPSSFSQIDGVSHDGLPVDQTSAELETKTGSDPAGQDPNGNPVGSEIEVDLNVSGDLPTFAADPNGAAHLAGLIEHFTLNGLGFDGLRASSGVYFGTLADPLESNFDALTQFGSGANASTLYFTGSHAEAVYGGPVPLTSLAASQSVATEDFYQLGLSGDLMTDAVASPFGLVGPPSALDVSVLADLGYSVNGSAVGLPGLTLHPTHAVNATLQRVGRGSSVTVTFSAAMNPSTLDQAGNATFTTPGATKKAKVLVVSYSGTPVYNSSNFSVTYSFPKRVFTKPLTLTLNGTSQTGIEDANNQLIDGDNDGQPGGDAVFVLKQAARKK